MSAGFCKSASQVVNILSCSLFTTCLAGVQDQEQKLSSANYQTQITTDGTVQRNRET